jgi:hypothetical protein
MPAAHTNPSGGSAFQRFATRSSSSRRRSARSIRPSFASSFRPARQHRLEQGERALPMLRQFLAPAPARGAAAAALPRSAAGRASRQARPPAAPPRPYRPAPRPPGSAVPGSSAAGADRPRAAPARHRRHASNTASSISGSPTATSRGSSSPPSLARTNASWIARLARLFGSSTVPRASRIGSPPNRRISPIASASAKARCGGMV